jgi:hypothetical protein
MNRGGAEAQRRKDIIQNVRVVSCHLVDRIADATTTIHELTRNSTKRLNHAAAPVRLCVWVPWRLNRSDGGSNEK